MRTRRGCVRGCSLRRVPKVGLLPVEQSSVSSIIATATETSSVSVAPHNWQRASIVHCIVNYVVDCNVACIVHYIVTPN